MNYIHSSSTSSEITTCSQTRPNLQRVSDLLFSHLFQKEKQDEGGFSPVPLTSIRGSQSSQLASVFTSCGMETLVTVSGPLQKMKAQINIPNNEHIIVITITDNVNFLSQ